MMFNEMNMIQRSKVDSNNRNSKNNTNKTLITLKILIKINLNHQKPLQNTQKINPKKLVENCSNHLKTKNLN